MYIDSHSHIYSTQFDDDNDAMLERAATASVTKILMPAIDSGTHKNMIAMQNQHPGFCYSMMGLHPCSVKENYEEELHIIQNYLAEKKFIAIGETGLDFYWDKTFAPQQYLAFEQQILWALEYNLPIVIHSRNATPECIELISQYISKGLTGVFHCFGGSAQEAQSITNMGFYLGIGGVLTFKKSGLDDVLKNISLDHIILETDAPYLAPVPYRGKRNEPAYLPHIAQKLADVKQMSLDEIARITTGNTKILFNI